MNALYARRPLEQKKRLKDEPWHENIEYIWRCVNKVGQAFNLTHKPAFEDGNWIKRVGLCVMTGEGYDTTDWQYSLEERPTRPLDQILEGGKTKEKLEKEWTTTYDASSNRCLSCGRETRIVNGWKQCHNPNCRSYIPEDEIAENGRNVGQLAQIPVEDRNGNDLGTAPLNGCLPGDEIMHRPWRIGDKIPAPLMVRFKSMDPGEWFYARPCKYGIRIMDDKGSYMQYQTAFDNLILHDNSVCGVAE
jgi:hypothetical protein